MPKKTRKLEQMPLKTGFELLPKRGKGSHSIYRHSLLKEDVKLSGNDGKDARKYQVKEVNRVIKEVKLNDK